jgi:hypothetical protein
MTALSATSNAVHAKPVKIHTHLEIVKIVTIENAEDFDFKLSQSSTMAREDQTLIIITNNPDQSNQNN